MDFKEEIYLPNGLHYFYDIFIKCWSANSIKNVYFARYWDHLALGSVFE